ncbi:uncharacterized protein MELLADRAFT_109666 [Melampsora larici-populina 98AG31]|uniref:Uncharacterized protein n=1 Tax=Melampsora larici-populina (strain 98AG31 / pathotype 3-4-7) TaxID=747676 RepID=F4RX87_MELLP|nr:uncharacterized protein MELLADRAFT_109666 [Melampsora larici-populina 98AG31]EGG02924.1 hypothetical protein MELLADRAFT_109666 [Melampsora larici-populina 98AG31]
MCTTNGQKGNSKIEIQESSSNIKTLETGSSQHSTRYIRNEATPLRINGNAMQLPKKSPRPIEGKGKAIFQSNQNWPTGSLHEHKSPIRYDADLTTGILRSASESDFQLSPYERFTNPYATFHRSPMKFPERELNFKKGAKVSIQEGLLSIVDLVFQLRGYCLLLNPSELSQRNPIKIFWQSTYSRLGR